MTIPDLISLILGSIRGQFYSDRPREFMRDERALTKAIARYGYECAHRSWHFQPQAILRDLANLLNEIKRADLQIGYLPVYLEGAVRRHIGQRAEELQAQARTIEPRLTKIVSGVKGVEAVREPSAVDILATVYRDLKSRKPARRQAKRQPTQPSLL